MDTVRRAFLAGSLMLPAAAAAAAAAQPESSAGAPTLPWISITDLGAHPKADAATNTRAFQAAFRQAVLLDGSKELHRAVHVPAGRYRLNAIEIGAGGSPDSWQLFGDGFGDSILEFQHLDGDAISVTGTAISICDLMVTASPERRRNGSGNGIAAQSPIRTRTQGRLQLTNVRVGEQPGDGILAINPELHRYDNVRTNGNGGAGFRWNGIRGGVSNLMSQVRAVYNGKEGICLQGKLAGAIFQMPQCLENGATQFLVDTAGGRSINIIEADIEANKRIKRGDSSVGLILKGSRHRIIGGGFRGLSEGIRLERARDCLIDMPHFSNSAMPTAMEFGVSEDAGSSNNRVIVGSRYTNVREVHVRGGD